MPRVKLTEHKSKQLLYRDLQKKYDGIAVLLDTKGTYHFSSPLSKLSENTSYVVKVDQGVKGRMKKGLVDLNVNHASLSKSIDKLVRKGYSSFLIETTIPHEKSKERYVSIERVREGFLVRYASVGGIDIEEKQNEIKSVVCHSDPPVGGEESRKSMDPSVSPQDDTSIKKISLELGVDLDFIQTLLDYFELNYISFLEINPLVVQGSDIHILDLAVEVDNTARFFVRDGWIDQDIVQDQQKSPEEIAIKKLSENSQAALSFTLLNPNGSVWVLLSGGGASITLADEFYNLGYGKDLGNYGEYSGNPSAEETYLYTKEVLKAMFKSTSKKKVILIGGGTANFTDVRITFQGIIRAFEDDKKLLKDHHVKVYVRRGGPMQKEGLTMMEAWLKEHDVYGCVAGPDMPLHEIVRKTL